MNIPGFLIILSISIVLTLFFVFALNTRGPWGSFWTFFLILFLGIWAVSLWVTPAGPVVKGMYWITLSIVGLLLALMLSISGTERFNKQKRNAITGKIIDAEPDNPPGIGIIFWILIVIFVFSIIVGINIS